MGRKYDLTGQIIGTWKVGDYAGSNKYKCTCTLCGSDREILGYYLMNNKYPKCKCTKEKDLAGRIIGDWLVISKEDNGWLCECQACKEKTRKIVSEYSLTIGASKSCGCKGHGLIDLTGKRFGKLKVIRKLPDKYWECQCDCDNVVYVRGDSLRNGKTNSCGCDSKTIREETVLDRYGVHNVRNIGSTRSEKQLEYTESKEGILKAISEVRDNSKDGKVTLYELDRLIGGSPGTAYSCLNRHNLLNMVDINQYGSHFESDIHKLFPNAILHDRKALKGTEIDLYFPEKHIGVEFNGNYWHSELFKDKAYHREKTLLGIENGIRIIHIFEYEWQEESTHSKLLNILNSLVGSLHNKVVYARNCKIIEIDKDTTYRFLDKYHLQNRAPFEYSIGLDLNGELLGLMTFGKPRFNSDCEYELIRMVWKNSITVVGGASKIFKHFVNKYDVNSVISYCDISKFNGMSYEKIGFKNLGVTAPNYKWVNLKTGEVLSRYQTQKSHLIEKGLGSSDMTEADIMKQLGFLRIYDCGNIKFVWEKDAAWQENII